jgi:hypothetical protein
MELPAFPPARPDQPQIERIPPRPDAEPKRDVLYDPNLGWTEIVDNFGETVLHEPSADERAAAGPVVVNRTPEELGMSAREIRTGFMLATAVFKNGGSFIITAEEQREHYGLMEDLAYLEATGNIRLFAVKH